jgi:tetratricopeptide (TPR) repeat protein
MSDTVIAMDDLLATLARAQELWRHGHERASARQAEAAVRAWTQCEEVLGEAASALTLHRAQILECAAGAALYAGNPEAGLASVRKSIDLLRDAHASGALGDIAFADRFGSVGMLLCAVECWDEAASVLTEATALFSTADGRPIAQHKRMAVSGALATALRFGGHREEALAVLRLAAAVAEPMVASSGGLEDRIELAHLHNMLGQVLLDTEQPGAALSVLRGCINSMRELSEATQQPGLRNLLAAALNRLGRAYAALGDRAEASACLGESVEFMRDLVRKEGLSSLEEDLRAAEEDLARLGG